MVGSAGMSSSSPCKVNHQNTNKTAYSAAPFQLDVKKIIIEGMTESGRKFRPSDWAERLSGALATFGRDHRIRYSPLLQPTMIDGIKCVIIDPRMQESFPEMYTYIMGWAAKNELKVVEKDVPADHN
jgi:hypothetical protein